MAAQYDLAGRRFGKLTVLRRTDHKEDHYFSWLCRCDCGNQIIVDTRRLTCGTVRHCGCEKGCTHRNRAEDLTGRRFSGLTVMERAENSPEGRARWKCRCDCGGTVTVSGHDLKAGRTRSCGCRKLNNHGEMLDLKGMRFGSLTAIKATEQRDCNGSVIWSCRCDCGKETEVSAGNLKSGRTGSCGCRREELGKNLKEHLTFVDGTCVEWIRSKKCRSDNKSGCTGVYAAANGNYKAYITLSGKRYHLGTYSSFGDAVRVRKHAEKVLHESFLAEYESWAKKSQGNSSWAAENPFHFEVTKAQLKNICM